MDSAGSSGPIFKFGLFEADVARHTLTRKGVRVKVQDQPFRTLILLLESPGEIVSRESLRHALWPEDTYVDFDGSLNVVLKKLRAAIDDDSENPRFVETVPRRGYRFIAPVSVETRKSRPAPSPAPDLIPVSVAADPAPSEGATPRWSTLHKLAIAMVVLVVVAGVAWFALHRKQSIGLPLQANAEVPLRKSVAVLGFQNVSGRASDAWLGTAFSEMLTTELGGGGKLRLVPGEEVANLWLSSPWPQAGTLDPQTTARIGTALSSDMLILGSYTAVGSSQKEQLRLDVRLQDARTGEILMESAENGDRENLFRVVSGIGAKLRSRLGIPLLDEPDQANVAASLPSDHEAARLYSLGLVKLREYDALAAKDLLQQACNADPKFALSHAMLAHAWSQLGYEQKRKEEAKKALDLSASLPQVDRMQVEGDYYSSLSNHEKAASSYRAMFELYPDNVDYGLQLAAAENSAGHASQAAETLAQLRRLPPPASDDPRIDLLNARAGPTNDPARLVLIRSAIRKASAQGKKLVYAQARKEECLNLNYSDHPADAPPACDDAYNIYMAAGNRLGAADAVRLLGDYEGGRGHLEEAIANYERALKILQELGEHYKTGAVLNNMAINFANQGQLDRAEQFYKQAKIHFEEAGDKADTATTLGNIADILFLRGNLSGAGKLYQQAINMQAALEHGSPGYLLFRLADLNLTEGNVREAHRLAQQGVDAIRPNQGAYGYLSEAMIELGAVLMAEAKLSEAHQQYQSALDLVQKAGENGLIEESHAELAELAIEEGHPDQAESLIRPAIAEFEREKSDPSSSGGYTVLSRALLALGRLDEARMAAQRAIALSKTSSDPGLRLPAAIQLARVEMQAPGDSADHSRIQTAVAELNSAAGSARKLGYYQLECEARLVLGEIEFKHSVEHGRAQLTALAAEAHSHGLELLAEKAQRAAHASATVVAFNTSLH